MYDFVSVDRNLHVGCFSMGIEMPIISFICVILGFVLFALHWKTRNVAILATIFWQVVSNIIYGINSTIWMGNAVIKYKIWCDISKF